MPHEHNEGAGKEHPKTHYILLSSIIIFVPVIILDLIFQISTQLALFIPIIIRIILFAIMLLTALIFMQLSHKSVFSDQEIKPLKKSGIYAHVRNPMYLVSPMIFIAFVLLTMSLISIVPIIVTFIMYTNMVKFEEKDLEKIFGQEYLDYKEKVPRWFPRLTPAKFDS
ncbi:MAG: isoprenylcysteine carboxylmethyltransferase family protein [archaeon]|nr:isoprenylcysteine carboxylmethyltransferase family protein [archaeon]